MMHIERHYPRDEAAMRQLVQSVIQPHQPIVAQAGHFLLFYDEKQQTVRACIAETNNPDEEPLLKSFGHFPLLTWDLCLRILNNTHSARKNVLLLVNDWQYLPKSDYRKEFYAEHPDLPKSFEASLAKFSDIELLRPKIETDEVVTGTYFGEMHLRNRYKKRVSKMLRNASLPPDVVIRDDGQHLTCMMPLSGGLSTEIYCSGKSSDCTAEVAELLLQVSASRPDSVFLNIFPIVCRDFVEKGTILASRLGGLRLPAVINVGFPSSRIYTVPDLFAGSEMSIYRFQ